MNVKRAVFVSVTNVTHINSTNICRYVVFAVCMVQEKEKEERERKSVKWCNNAPYFLKAKPLIFKEISTLYFLSSLVCVCLGEMKQAKNVGLL